MIIPGKFISKSNNFFNDSLFKNETENHKVFGFIKE